MTPRQEQFLEALQEICRHRPAAHYSDVALRLRVSKWTAYDMMNRLEEAGYVERLYELDAGARGRSRILFRPAARADRPGERPAASVTPGEWQSLRPWLLQQADRARGQGAGDVLHDLHQALRRDPSPMTFCAVFTALLLITLKTLVNGLEGAWLVQTFLPLLSAQLGLLVFAGAALAIIYQGSQGPRPMAADIRRYQAALSRLDEKHQADLGDLARDLASRLWDDEAALA